MHTAPHSAAPNPDVFKNHFEKGIDAFQRGEYRVAKVHFVDAALALEKLIDSTFLPEVKAVRQETLVELTSLAEACDDAGKRTPVAAAGNTPNNRATPGKSGKGQEGDDAVTVNVADFRFTGSRVRFDQIIGHEGAKERLRETMILPFQHPEAFKRKGLSAGGGLLLFGPPGTGKTDLAAAAAAEVDADFYNVRCADLMSKWFGDSERKVKALFTGVRKESKRAILFLDDCASMLARPSEGSTSDVQRRVLGEFQVELQGLASRGSEERSQLLVIAATNEPWIIDPSMLRRLQFGGGLIYMGLPNTEDRERILEVKTVNIDLDRDVDFKALAAATEGYSGSDLTNICQGAILASVKQGIAEKRELPVSQTHFIEQLNRIKPSTSPSHLARFEKWNNEFGAK